MAKLLVIDTETAGLDPQRHSMLSLGAVIWENGNIGDSFDVLIAEPEICVDPDAMLVNRINLDEHCAHASAPGEATLRFLSFLEQNFGKVDAREKVDLVGHNVGFDVGFLDRLLQFSGVRVEQLFSHRYLDTASIIRFLILANKVSLSGASSTEAFEYFGVAIPPHARHTALRYAKATAQLLNKLLDVLQ